jgi:hypothetical protein
MIPWPNLPYESLGRFAFVIITVLVVVLLALVVLLAAYRVWYRALTFICNAAWGGYDFRDEQPPPLRRSVAIIAVGLRDFDLAYMRKVRDELDKLQRADD